MYINEETDSARVQVPSESYIEKLRQNDILILEVK